MGDEHRWLPHIRAALISLAVATGAGLIALVSRAGAFVALLIALGVAVVGLLILEMYERGRLSSLWAWWLRVASTPAMPLPSRGASLHRSDMRRFEQSRQALSGPGQPDAKTKLRSLVVTGQDAENRAQILALQAMSRIGAGPLHEAQKTLDFQAAERILAGWNRTFDVEEGVAIATLIDRAAQAVTVPVWAAPFGREYEQFRRRCLWLADQAECHK